MNIRKKKQLAAVRRARVRRRIAGTTERPRMAVRFTGEHIYVQFVDDQKGVTLAAASTRAKAAPADGPRLKANVASAKVVGAAAAAAAAAAGITSVVFDRGASMYHGKVAALADAARAAGLKF